MRKNTSSFILLISIMMLGFWGCGLKKITDDSSAEHSETEEDEEGEEQDLDLAKGVKTNDPRGIVKIFNQNDGVMFNFNDGVNKAVCSGIALSEDYVLTAHHCVVDKFGNVSAPNKLLVDIDPSTVRASGVIGVHSIITKNPMLTAYMVMPAGSFGGITFAKGEMFELMTFRNCLTTGRPADLCIAEGKKNIAKLLPKSVKSPYFGVVIPEDIALIKVQTKMRTIPILELAKKYGKQKAMLGGYGCYLRNNGIILRIMKNIRKVKIKLPMENFLSVNSGAVCMEDAGGPMMIPAKNKSQGVSVIGMASLGFTPINIGLKQNALDLLFLRKPELPNFYELFNWGNQASQILYTDVTIYNDWINSIIFPPPSYIPPDR